MDEQKTPTNHSNLSLLIAWKVIKQSQRFMRNLLITFLIFICILGLSYLYLRSKPLPPPDSLIPSQIYTEQGEWIGQMEPGEKREPIRLKEMPRSLIQATLAAEDRTFYEHGGFSLKGILRATFVNLKEGRVVQGASTITQQLARNLYLTHDRTWARKLKEALYTLQLEIHYSKDEILEMYLNEIYYGHGAYGVGSAAQMYLHKSARDLTLAESAYLAGIPRGPEIYSPYQNPKRIQQRQQHILNLMVKNKMITAHDADTAKDQHIAIYKPQRLHHVKANYFRDYLVQTIVAKYGLEESVVRHGGLKIYTTLDPKLQTFAEQSVKQHLANHPDLQGALVSVDPHTGHIKAMIGGKDYSQSQYNRVFARRQPGSSFKPLLYLGALEQGFTALTQIDSQPTTFTFQGGSYKPNNFRNQYAYRPITLREAIARSDNIYAVSTGLQIGIEQTIQTAKKLGVKSEMKPTPSLALGAYPMSPFELTQAYATIAAGGKQYPLTGVIKITDPYGRVLVEEKTTFKQVASPTHTFLLTHLMSSVFEPGGTGHRVKQMFSRPIAGKTGTTDWDGWLTGYTPDLVTTVWVGYDQGRKLPHAEARLSQYIWGSYMKQATADRSSSVFTIPPGVKGVTIDTQTGELATPACTHTHIEYFVSGTEPKKICHLHPKPTTPPPPEPSLWNKIIDWIKGI